MNEFTIFNGTIWFSDADSVYKHLYPEHGFEVESLGVSDRFVSEDAFIAQRNLKDEYMRRDQKHSETISELRKELKEKQDYIKTLENRIASQRIDATVKENNRLDAILKCDMYRKDIEARDNEIKKLEMHNEELENENKVLKARLKDTIGIEYTDSTDYIAQMHKNVLNQRKELRNLNKVLEKERKRNKELEELYSSAQKSVAMLNLKVMELKQSICNSADLKELRNLNKALERERKRNKELDELYSGAQKNVSMLNLKVMELNQGIRNSTDLTWKEKYDELNAKYTSDSTSLNCVINELRKRLKQKDEKIEALESGIKELSEANDGLKKKIRTIEYNDIGYLKRRCAKAEHTIDVIKRALVDSDYILRRNEK